MSAAGEEMKSILLNGDDMVGVYEKLADVLETIATFVDSFGGLKTIVLGLVYAFMQMQSSKVTNFFSEMGVHIHNVGEKLKWLGTFGKKGSWNPMLNMKKEATILGSEGLAN
jgi:hypothetical protein